MGPNKKISELKVLPKALEKQLPTKLSATKLGCMYEPTEKYYKAVESLNKLPW